MYWAVSTTPKTSFVFAFHYFAAAAAAVALIQVSVEQIVAVKNILGAS